ncbi:MAG: flagellar motor switch protein FliN [Phycisphaeraceae bacterium]|nr:flagellar motor switch protein FliN [Phycisphaeraceae bacterium]
MSDQNDVDDLLAQSLNEAQGQVDGMQEEIASAVGPAGGDQGGIDMLGDVDLDVTIELGRTEMLVEDVLRLASGSVVELNKLAGDPVDVYVNSRLVARGEVLVLNDNFCIRISEILAEVKDTPAVQEAMEAAAGPGAAAD